MNLIEKNKLKNKRLYKNFLYGLRIVSYIDQIKGKIRCNMTALECTKKSKVSNLITKALEDELSKLVKTLVMLIYVKHKRWDKVGICEYCEGTGSVLSSSPMAHSGEEETCSCYYTVKGWELANSMTDYSTAIINPLSINWREVRASIIN